MYERYEPGDPYRRGWPPPDRVEDDDDEARPRHHYPYPPYPYFPHYPHGSFPEKCRPAIGLLAQAAELTLAAPGAIACCATDMVKDAVNFAKYVVCESVCCCKPLTDPCCHPPQRHDCCSPHCHPDCHCHCHAKPLEFHRPSTDLFLKAREQEKRVSSILVRNNMPDQVTITPQADPWRDAVGHPVSGTAFQFNPASFPIDPREAKSFLAIAEIDPTKLEGGKVYFTQIHLEGSRAKPLTVGLSVIRDTHYDAYATTDPCRSRGRWVEVCHEPDYPWWFCCPKCKCSPCRCSTHMRHPWAFLCQWHPLSGRPSLHGGFHG
jgi:hypothetical protein